MAKSITLLAVVLSSILIANFVIAPAFATRTIQVTKQVDVKKDLFAKQLTDLKSYKEIFPTFVKDVKIDQSTNRAKFVIDAQGRKEAYVKSTNLQNGTLLIEIVSGDLKGSKVVTTLGNRLGFDGTPNGATTIHSTLVLETNWFVTLALSFVDDKTISNAVGDGFYEIGQYAKLQATQKQPIQVDYEKPSSKTTSVKNSVTSKKVTKTAF
jgi:hypothetical protein